MASRNVLRASGALLALAFFVLPVSELPASPADADAAELGQRLVVFELFTPPTPSSGGG